MSASTWYCNSKVIPTIICQSHPCISQFWLWQRPLTHVMHTMNEAKKFYILKQTWTMCITMYDSSYKNVCIFINHLERSLSQGYDQSTAEAQWNHLKTSKITFAFVVFRTERRHQEGKFISNLKEISPLIELKCEALPKQRTTFIVILERIKIGKKLCPRFYVEMC